MCNTHVRAYRGVEVHVGTGRSQEVFEDLEIAALNARRPGRSQGTEALQSMNFIKVLDMPKLSRFVSSQTRATRTWP